ncbi:hypothetical protein BD311DRAFT_497961 [Dichomitus squalens]|uniref:Uncharacterized protein n=1 Tax=Dichomitus squalens TaxID=114155 RepID=A0A4Q9MFE2_9APHY|nr:hypothetical protein BD311DRAFT_497961 [Dichomitus squalens]
MAFQLSRALLIASSMCLRRALHTDHTSIARELFRASRLAKHSSALGEEYEAARRASYQQYKNVRSAATQLRDAASTRHHDAGSLPPEDIEPRMGHIRKYLDALELEYKLRKAHHAKYDGDLDQGHQRRLQALEEQIWHHRDILRILTSRLRQHLAETEPQKSLDHLPELLPEPCPPSMLARRRDEAREKGLRTLRLAKSVRTHAPVKEENRHRRGPKSDGSHEHASAAPHIRGLLGRLRSKGGPSGGEGGTGEQTRKPERKLFAVARFLQSSGVIAHLKERRPSAGDRSSRRLDPTNDPGS